jgi:hypothetical protein
MTVYVVATKSLVVSVLAVKQNHQTIALRLRCVWLLSHYIEAKRHWVHIYEG